MTTHKTDADSDAGKVVDNDELRVAVGRIIGTAILKNDKNYTNDMMQLIKSDRTKHENRARLDEIRYVENYFDGEYFHADEWQKRIQVLKSKLESLNGEDAEASNTPNATEGE